jgi:hypothetical protein
MSMDALASVTESMPGVRILVVLNRFDGGHDIHRRNRQWLESRDGYQVVTMPGEELALAGAVLGVD